nr:MAG TPA: hypothetical protein [Caudoviricetes sp.]
MVFNKVNISCSLLSIFFNICIFNVFILIVFRLYFYDNFLEIEYFLISVYLIVRGL